MMAETSEHGGPPTRADWAEQILRADILAGRLKPGERIKIGELVERYQGLSPTPLREALSRLAGSGLVEFVPQRGVRVAQGSKADLLDVYEIRIMLEMTALKRSLQKADEGYVADVKKAMEDLRALSNVDGDPARMVAWEEAHRRFHSVLLERCGSPWLLKLTTQLFEHSTRYRNQSLGVRGTEADILREHLNIAEAAIAGDRKKAVAALTDHLRLTVDALVESLE
ncbi:MAG: FCD domain-containing protein [Actinobacteria bacterium]|nr:FCD domain-containing protein [Actinomycetota bacterium]